MTSADTTAQAGAVGAGAGNAVPIATRAAARGLVTPDRLAEFFAPRSVAMVGASESSGWSRFIVAASSAVGFTGPLLPVHPRHQRIFGRPAAASLRHLAEPADLAFILAPTQAVAGVIEDAAAAGVRNVVVLASGYREAARLAGHWRTIW